MEYNNFKLTKEECSMMKLHLIGALEKIETEYLGSLPMWCVCV
jgi:hypothetical protein